MRSNTTQGHALSPDTVAAIGDTYVLPTLDWMYHHPPIEVLAVMTDPLANDALATPYLELDISAAVRRYLQLADLFPGGGQSC